MKLPTSQRHRNLEPDSAEFLSVLAKACRSQQLLEIGGSSGLATIALAAAARANDGRVVSIEIEADRQAEARQTLASLGRADHVEFVLEDAATALARHPALEFVLIDCEKEDYVRFFDQLHLVEHGAIVVADDILSHALDRFVAHVRGRPDVESITLPIGKGLEVTSFR